jgi:DNA-binding CsgD family transcriptional regulator
MSGTNAAESMQPHLDEHERRQLVEHAVRHLIGIVEADASAGNGSEILLDLTYGQARCVVRRTRLHNAAARQPTLPESLSPREMEIARMVARGFTNKEIANVLDISSWTVSTHLRRVFSKLSVGTRAAMVARLMDRSDDS